MFIIYRFFIFFLLCSTLNACMLGPNFHSPVLPPVSAYIEKPLPKKMAQTRSIGIDSGKTQTLVNDKDIPAEWWYVFRSSSLNKLIKAGIDRSPNLTAAYASLRIAQETLNAKIGNSLLPTLNMGLVAQRQRFPTSSLNTQRVGIFNLFNVSSNISYPLDIFGGMRREIEALYAQIDYQQFQLIAAYLTLTTNIVTTVVMIASLDAQIQTTHDLLKAQEDQLFILNKQLELGGVSQEIILTQQTLVNQTRATLPPLEKSLSQALHALSVLVGYFPNQTIPIIPLDRLYLPARLPVSLPSHLVRQRPDVRAAEALLHVATAQIGVATAHLFPQFTITGNGGWDAIVWPQLFTSQSTTWSIAGQITQPLFHGGALLAQRRQAIAVYEQIDAQYRQVVLQAFQNVADVLKALETDAKTLHAQIIAENSARHNFILTKNQYRLGSTSYLALLNAQQQYQLIRLSRIKAQAARYIDTAALFQSLGGGWWNQAWCVKECLHEV